MIKLPADVADKVQQDRHEQSICKYIVSAIRAYQQHASLCACTSPKGEDDGIDTNTVRPYEVFIGKGRQGNGDFLYREDGVVDHL